MKISTHRYRAVLIANSIALVLLLTCCKSQITPIKTSILTMQQVEMNGTIDATTDSIISTYRNDITKLMNRQIGECDELLEAYRPEGGLSRFAADVVLIEAQKVCTELNIKTPMLSLLNTGGIRASLHKGTVTVQNIFEISPFENSLVIITLSGEELQEAFQHIAQRGGEPLSGATLTICNGNAKKITINNTPLNSDQQYILATNSYLAAGGDGFKMLKNTKQFDTGIMIRDLMIKHVELLGKNGQHIVDPANTRITVENE